MATETKVLNVDWGATGATLFYRVVDADGDDLISRTSDNVNEFPAGSGLYSVKVTAWDTDWLHARVIWDDGSDYALGEIEPVQLFDADGVSEELFRIVMLAFAVNLNDVTDISANNRRVNFKLRDGSTTVVQVNYDPETGDRSVSTITPP